MTKENSSIDWGKLPKTKMQLVDKVGSQGTYQKMLLVIFCAVTGITGMAFMGSTFFFINSSFKCAELGLLTDDCESAICSLPSSQWDRYTEIGQDELKTVANSFGKYYCDDSIYLDLAQSSTYIGGFIGYIFFSFLADNYGRKPTYVLSWGIASFGAMILVCSVNLPMVAVGLFLLGAGSGVALNMGFYFLGEMVEDNTRQKYSVILQPWFASGAVLVTTMFLIINNWRIVAIILIAGPSLIVLFFIVIYIQETPQFLIRKGVPATLKALNRIGKINRGIKNILSEQDVINVINQQVEEKKYQKVMTVVDLCRFPSLRIVTIGMSFSFFSICVLYYGPALEIDKIGFNIFVSSYVVQFSELIVYIPLFFYIDYLPRKKAAIVLFTTAGLCSTFLLFYQKPKDCDFCAEAIVELFVVAIFRASSALEYIILYIYLVELYPARTRALGGGIVSSCGTLASSLSPIILGILERNNIDSYILFTILAFLALGASTFLNETLGVPLKQEIEEIEHEKQKVKKTGYLVIKDISQYKSQMSGYQPIKALPSQSQS